MNLPVLWLLIIRVNLPNSVVSECSPCKLLVVAVFADLRSDFMMCWLMIGWVTVYFDSFRSQFLPVFSFYLPRHAEQSFSICIGMRKNYVVHSSLTLPKSQIKVLHDQSISSILFSHISMLTVSDGFVIDWVSKYLLATIVKFPGPKIFFVQNLGLLDNRCKLLDAGVQAPSNAGQLATIH